MRLLLDTHILLWALGDDPRLTAAARGLIEDPANDVLFSAASVWEIAIKASLRKPDFIAQPDGGAGAAGATGCAAVVAPPPAAAGAGALPPHHRDPFDRLLVAQAISETVRLLTADVLLAPYSELVMLIC